VAGDKTANSLDSLDGDVSLNAGLNLSSMDGASTSLNAAIHRNISDTKEKAVDLGKSIGFSYNSRAGLAGMTLGTSFNVTKEFPKECETIRKHYNENASSSFLSFNGDTYTPSIDHPTRNISLTFSATVGPELWVAYAGLGITGFYSVQSISQRIRRSPAFGFLY